MRPTASRHDELYDEYLDAVLRGRAEAPEAFLARRQVEHDSELLAHLAAVYDLVGDVSSPDRGDAPADFGLPFERLGDFRVLRRLGTGGMGVVYLAEQESLGRPVALKVLRPEAAQSPSALARFEREARAIAQLRHPSIVAVHAVGVADDVHYIAMELVPGRGLDELIDEATSEGSRLEVVQVVRWGAEIAEALACAHAAGIVHRDVKPSNIRVTPDGRALLLDFGLARSLDHGGTVTQSFLGSPTYAAPEQIGSTGPVDERADVYALGVVLYECLSGHAPFEGETLEGLMHRVLTEDPAPLRSMQRRLPRDLDTVITTALEKEPQRRYANAASMAGDLRAVLAFRPIVARRRGPAGRAVRWARRHRSSAIGVAIGLGAILVASGLMVGQSVMARRDRAARMRADLDRAAALVDRAYERLLETQKEEVEYGILMRKSEEAHMNGAERRRLDDLAERTRRHGLERERTFFEALDVISSAERLGAPQERLQQLRAGLFIARYSEVTTLEQDPVAGDFFLDMARRADPAGAGYDLTSRIMGTRSIDSIPSGAEVYQFRMREHATVVPGGEPRQMATRPDGTVATAGSDWALRVVGGRDAVRSGAVIVRVAGAPVRSAIFAARDVAGGVRRLDRIAAVDGAALSDGFAVRAFQAEAEAEADGDVEMLVAADVERSGSVLRVDVSATALAASLVTARTLVEQADPERAPVPIDVYIGGARRSTVAPAGLDVRVTATPRIIEPVLLAGTTPARDLDYRGAETVFVVRAPGHEDYVIPVEEGDVIAVDLRPEHTTPRGYVFVPPVRDAPGFCMMEHEVTFRQYMEFLDDPATSERIEASGGDILVPRKGAAAYIERDGERRSVLTDGLDPDMPVFGVSWFDAREFARWQTRLAQAQGRAVVFGLPTREEWARAGGDKWGRPYVWGQHFRQHFASSCFARATPYPEPVMSFPIDESVLGVYDMSGSVSEWLDEWWLEDRNLRTAAGGSWAHGDPELFRIFGGHGYSADQTYDTVGFRLVMREAPE